MKEAALYTGREVYISDLSFTRFCDQRHVFINILYVCVSFTEDTGGQ